jgi:hypothetical protein
MFPSQQRALAKALKKADKFDDFRGRTRRSFIALATAGACGCIGAFFLGRGFAESASPASADPWRTSLPWAREFSRQPVETLIQGASTYLSVLQNAGGDELELWQGFAKLATYALENSDTQAQALRARLRVFCSRVRVPAQFQSTVQQLQTRR